ncbi:hypothetical protein [Streptomyces qinzhouensis]|uniref:Glycosyl hydrolase n=1 Tax=Streptomyces qinzhouensis TaxID=2599401 RepID=A0A5B8JK53_9ACTN|nr:hypothetical protein [Streptomyces qinzhouensis]QDY78180.1 hypothetical protein FQU76_18680 [Streptomyces qinzhouensis]
MAITSSGPDYRLEGFAPEDEIYEDSFAWVTLSDDQFVPLAAHHTGDDRHTFHLVYDRSTTWDVPGTAPYLTLHITRDQDARTFSFGYEHHPLVPLAQNWLLQGGCPPEGAVLTNADGPRPADALTTDLESLLRTNPGDRYTVLEHYNQPWDTWTLLHDAHPGSAEAPYRLFLDEVGPDRTTYTVRESAFPTREAARGWLSDTDLPLPHARTPSPAPVVSRAEAAVTRSPRTPARLAVPPNPVTTPRTATVEAARTGRGRS